MFINKKIISKLTIKINAIYPNLGHVLIMLYKVLPFKID